jgi:hypothetical protein
MLLQELAANDTKDPEDILKILRRDCKPFLSAGLSHPFYRGLPRAFAGKQNPIVTLEYDLKEVHLIKMTRQHDRKPTGTNPAVHELFDTLFNSKFGWKARSSGVFATADWAQADGYGVPFAFFPIGNFHSLWSAEVYDLFAALPRGLETMIVHGSSKEKVEGKIRLRHYFDTLDYQADNLKGTDGVNREVMFDCDSYYLVEAHGKWDVNEHPVLKELFK